MTDGLLTSSESGMILKPGPVASGAGAGISSTWPTSSKSGFRRSFAARICSIVTP
jgi:hypothetical protein